MNGGRISDSSYSQGQSLYTINNKSDFDIQSNENHTYSKANKELVIISAS